MQFFHFIEYLKYVFFVLVTSILEGIESLLWVQHCISSCTMQSNSITDEAEIAAMNFLKDNPLGTSRFVGKFVHNCCRNVKLIISEVKGQSQILSTFLPIVYGGVLLEQSLSLCSCCGCFLHGGIN